jgi:hypothetical protein
VAEGGGLLNRCRVKSSTGGSNPPLSASKSAVVYFAHLKLQNHVTDLLNRSGFHGSLTPRPGVPGSYDSTFGGVTTLGSPLGLAGSVGQALGLPAVGCEFGACGAGPSAFGSADDASAASSINVSPWVFYILALAHVPNDGPSPTWSRWKSCVATGFGTVADQMDPFKPSVSNAVQGAVDSASQAALAGAAVHSVERGLTVPLRSSIVRAGVGASEALREASGWITIANLYYGIAKAYKAEWQQCGW